MIKACLMITELRRCELLRSGTRHYAQPVTAPTTRPRLRLPLTSLAALTLAGATLTACGTGTSGQPGAGGQPGASATRTTIAAASPGVTPTTTPTSTPAIRRASLPVPVAPGAASRPQTMTRPGITGRAFRAMVTDLWLAVRTGKPGLGRASFFPVGAYKQVKAIADPAADWRARLWDDFALDVRAAHRLLGPHARSARLVKVLVAASDAAWIDPGVCYNGVGYWHVANSRVVYRLHEHGPERSFGIASLISWRGVWYVVHFGGVVRPAVGLVDAPAEGPGEPGPQGGC